MSSTGRDKASTSMHDAWRSSDHGQQGLWPGRGAKDGL